MKLLWKVKKKESDVEQQGACLKARFRPPTVVGFSCAERGSSPNAFLHESKQQKGHDRTAGLISVPRARQKQILGLAPVSLTGVNRVILPSLQGRQAPALQRLVVQHQLSVWSRSGSSGLPAASHHAAGPPGVWSTHSPGAGRGSGRWSCWGRSGCEATQTKIFSRIFGCVMGFVSLLPYPLNVIIFHLPLFDYLLLLVAYGEPAAFVGMDT